MDEAQVCEALDIGCPPFHQALIRLTLESLMAILPRKGVILEPDGPKSQSTP